MMGMTFSSGDRYEGPLELTDIKVDNHARYHFTPACSSGNQNGDRPRFTGAKSSFDRLREQKNVVCPHLIPIK
jgi:hypothetical protein